MKDVKHFQKRKSNTKQKVEKHIIDHQGSSCRRCS